MAIDSVIMAIFSIHFPLIFIACCTAVACTLPGTFLVLRGMALMSDAISHAMLLGIVSMFLVLHNLHSSLLLMGAAIAAFFTVLLTEMLVNTSLLKKDTAIGLVFPLFFSAGVILISQYAYQVHLDIDMVLLGELLFAPLSRFYIVGYDCGPQAMWVMSAILLFNIAFVSLFYKELKMSSFDQVYAEYINYSPRLLHYFLMIITCITAVGSFEVVGSVVTVALMIIPAATAFIGAKSLEQMVKVSIIVAIVDACVGYIFSVVLDVSVAGSIALIAGIVFLIILLLDRLRLITQENVHC